MNNTKVPTVRVGLIDDHPMVREGLENVVQSTPGIQLTLSCAEPQEAFSYLQTEELDILLLDVSLGDDNGLLLIEKFLEIQPSLKVIILTVSDNETSVVKAFAQGACGYLLKECDREQIASAILCASGGVAVLAPLNLLSRVFQGWLHSGADPSGDRTRPSLTERELEVLKLVARGHSNKEIAKTLFLAESTIKKYSHNAMGKLGTTNRGAAAIRAIRIGLIDLEDSPNDTP